MQEEIWKDIKGYGGSYQVSNLGRVRSVTRMVDCKCGKRTTKGKVLKLFKTRNDYFCVDLRKNQKHKSMFAHRLVAENFIDNPYNYSIINHKDSNPENNTADNLEWCTQSYNVKYAYINGNAKPTDGCFKKGNIPHNLRKVAQYDKKRKFLKYIQLNKASCTISRKN